MFTMMLLHLYQIFSSLQCYLHFSVHFFFTFMANFFFNHSMSCRFMLFIATSSEFVRTYSSWLENWKNKLLGAEIPTNEPDEMYLAVSKVFIDSSLCCWFIFFLKCIDFKWSPSELSEVCYLSSISVQGISVGSKKPLAKCWALYTKQWRIILKTGQ